MRLSVETKALPGRRRRPPAGSFLPVILAFLVSFNGCAFNKELLKTEHVDSPDEKSRCRAAADELFGSTLATFESIRSLKARTSVKFVEDGKLNRSVSAVVLYKEPGSVRVDLYSPLFGAVGTWIASKDTVLVFDSRKDVYYEAGDPEEAGLYSEYGVWLEIFRSGVLAGVVLPLDEYGNMIDGFDLVESREVPGFIIRTETRDYIYLFEPDCEEIRSVSVTGPEDGPQLFEVIFEDYDTIQGIRYPGWIRLLSPDTGEELKIKFTDRRFNEDISDAVFSSVRGTASPGN